MKSSKTQERFRGLQPLANGKALVEDYERNKRIVRTMEIDLEKPGSEAKVIFSRNERDAYHDPGTPLMKTTAGRPPRRDSGGRRNSALRAGRFPHGRSSVHRPVRSCDGQEGTHLRSSGQFV